MPVDPNATLLAGPTLIGCFMAYFLFGAYFLQLLTYLYDIPTKTQKKANHMLIALVTLIEAVNISLISHATWDRLVLSKDIPAVEWAPPVTAPGTGVLNGMVASVVQLYFAHKVWMLGAEQLRPKLFAGGIVLLSLTQLGGAVATAAFFSKSAQHYGGNQLNSSIIVYLSTSALCDVLITTALVTMLKKYKKNTVFNATKQILTLITRHTLENGLATTLCAVVNLIVYLARGKDDNIHMVFQYMIGRLWAIVLVASLNRTLHPNSGSTQGTSGNSFPTGGNNNAVPLANTHRSVDFNTMNDRLHPSRMQVQVTRHTHDDFGDGAKGAAAPVPVEWPQGPPSRDEVYDREKGGPPY